ncbi:MAG: hypothetical protein HQM09_06620 [Candidatus Riflebacteria bacterium]|nr:hypothetical protein [Candidatus Riflebacteria bacterium]
MEADRKNPLNSSSAESSVGQNRATAPQEIQFVRESVYNEETHCPSCGRFVGIYERCPYCQALTRKRLSIRVFKVIAVLTSTVGLALLLFFAQTIKTPEVKIDQLGPLSNFAHVRVIGTVERSYGVHPQWKSLAFTLAQTDSKGEARTIRVSAYAKVATDIEKQKKVPLDGDEISVEGQVRFQKDSPSLLINAPEHLSIIKRAEEETVEQTSLEPAQVSKEHLGKMVTVKGGVADVAGFPRGMLVRLEDGGQGLAVWLPSKLADDMNLSIQAGDIVEAKGKVKPYKDSLEIEVTSQTGFKVLEKGRGDTIHELAPAGRESETSVDGSSSGNASSVSDSVSTSTGPQTKHAVVVTQSAGVLDASSPVAISTASPSDELPLTPVAGISKNMLGQSVRVIGTLNKIDAFKTGIKMLIKDGGGQISVWMSTEVGGGAPVPSEGTKLSVVGNVALFKEELQIQLRNAADLTVLP